MTTALLLALAFAADPKPKAVPLYADKIPGPVSSDPANVPTLSFSPAPKDKANGCAVVVIPGGGYYMRAADHEGKQITAWLNDRGIAAFELKYRTVGESKISPPLAPGPMLDVQRAIRMVRAKAKEHGIDPQRIGVWGFSAGGHLASTAATHFDTGKNDAEDPIERVSCRPNFMILAYPVISMEPGTSHMGSRDNLIGKNPDPKLVENLSNEKQVTEQTPPTFLFHTTTDSAVLTENSVQFYLALR